MPISQSVRAQAFQHSSGRCECTSQHEGEKAAPHHGGRCPRIFPEVWGWEAHLITPESQGGQATIENCQVLCTDCYKPYYSP